jgi:hypothetical protein
MESQLVQWESPTSGLPFLPFSRHQGGEAGFQSDGAVRARGELGVLDFRRHGAVHGADGVDGAVHEAFPKRHAVFLTAKRREHLVVHVEGFDRAVVAE